MINAVYLNTVAQTAGAAMSGTALPSISGKLLSHLPITAIFFAGDAVVTIDENTGKCVIKPKDAPAGGPALIDTTAELVTVGSDTHYLFEWASADSVELRAFLDAQADPTQPVEMRCEIEYAIDGETARIAFPILMQTSYSRPDDPIPLASEDTGWSWLKQRAPDANGFTHDDESRTLGVSTFSGAWNDISGKPSTFPPSAHSHAISDVTGLQGALDAKATAAELTSEASSRAAADATLQSNINGKANATHTHAISDVTGLQGALDAKATAAELTSEASSRAAADATLQSNINGKANATHTHAISDVTGLQGELDAKAAASHASRHKSGGADSIKLDELAAPTDVITLNATTSAHGLLPKLGGGTANFLRADGSWAAPAGGGGGGLVRGSGVLKGNTTPAGSPTGANCFVNIYGGGSSGTLFFDFSGTPFTIAFSESDPFDGSIWIDNTTFGSAGEYASAIESFLLSQGAYVTNVVRSEFNITFNSLGTGLATYVNVTTSMSGVSVSGYTTGSDAPPGYGAVLEVEIIPAVIGKTLYPVRVWGVSDGIGMNMDVCLKEGGTYYPLCNEFYAGTLAWESLNGMGGAPFGPYAVRWFNGILSASLVARLLGETIADGGTTTIYAICERQAP